MFKKFAPFLLLLPLALMALLSFFGCGTVSSSGGGGGAVPLAGSLYVSGYLSNEVYVLDPNTLAVKSIIKLPDVARGNWMGLSPDGKKLCITDYSGTDVYVINTETVTCERTINAHETSPMGIAFTATGTTAVVAQDDWISHIGVENGLYLDSRPFIDASGNGYGAALNPLNNRIYVVASTNRILSYAISGYSSSQNTTIDAEALYGDNCWLRDISFPAGTNRFFVTKTNWPYGVMMFNSSDESYINTVTSESAMVRRIAAAPNGGMLYMNDGCYSQINTLNVNNPTSIDIHAVSGGSVAGIAVSLDSNYVFVFAYDSPHTRVVKLDKNLNFIASAEVPSTLGSWGSLMMVP